MENSGSRPPVFEPNLIETIANGSTKNPWKYLLG